jgi:glucose/arabinose dehydrogenase
MHRTHVEAGHRRRLLLVFTLAGGAGVTRFAPAAQAQLAAGDPSARFEMSNWATGLTGPTDLEFLPDGRAVILLKGGEVIVRRRDGTLARRSGQVAVKILNDEQGLLGVAVDPDFTRTKAIYLFASAGDTAVDKHQILRATVSDDDRVQIDAKPIVDKGLEGPANHDGGGLVVHKGQLYFSVGDTGWNATPPTNKYPSCLNKPNGKILRVELDGKVPTDNPLVGLAEVTGCADPGAPFRMMPPDTRVFAWGMRNPTASGSIRRRICCGSATWARPRARRSRWSARASTSATRSGRARSAGRRSAT